MQLVDKTSSTRPNIATYSAHYEKDQNFTSQVSLNAQIMHKLYDDSRLKSHQSELVSFGRLTLKQPVKVATSKPAKKTPCCFKSMISTSSDAQFSLCPPFLPIPPLPPFPPLSLFLPTFSLSSPSLPFLRF